MNQVVTIGKREVLIANVETVSAKFIAVVCKLIEHSTENMDALRLNAIVLDDEDLVMAGEFGDDDAVGVMAASYADAGVIVINLADTFSKAFDLLEKFENVSLYPVYWHNMLQNVAHEITHLAQMAEYVDGPKKWLTRMIIDRKFREQMETDAKTTSLELVEDFCQTYDSEPPAWGEEKYFAANAVILYGGEDGAATEDIARLNDRVFVSGTVGDKEVLIQDFRSYMALNSDNPEDEVWSKDLLPVIEGAAPVASSFQAALQENTVDGNATVVLDDVYDDIPEGPEAVEGDAGPEVAFMGGAFGGTAGPLPSIPFNAPQPTATPGAPSTGPYPTAQQQFSQPSAGNFSAGDGGAAFASPQATQPMGGVQMATQTTPVAEVYPNHNLDPVIIRDTWYSVATKCFDHLFKVCQPNSGGQPHENIYPFIKGDAVMSQPVLLTEQEKMVVVKCECMNAMGQRREAKSTADGEIRGWLTPDKKIPMYKLWINANGQEIIRTIVPQNPNKRDAQNVLSQPASMARQGVKIAYVFEGNDLVKRANPTASLKAKCTNGQWQVINA